MDYLLGREELGIKGVVDKEVVRLPIVGTIRAGEPILAVENYEGHHVIERKYLTEGYEYFFLRVKGDSMNIIAPEGSLALIRKQNAVSNGDIAVVLVNRHDATLKKFYRYDDCVTLMPMSTNPDHQPQVHNTKDMDVEIVGKAVKIVMQKNL